jgi:WD40 repeat protein
LAADSARDRERETIRHLYVAQMNLARRAWEESNPGRVLALLDAQRPERTGGIDLRGFEWRYWWDRCHSDLMTVDTGHQITALAHSPDGKVYSAAGSALTLWDAESGVRLHALEGHDGWVSAVAFSPDGSLLASGGKDRTVRLWDVRTGRLVLAIPGHAYPIQDVTFHPDGRRLVSVGGDQDPQHIAGLNGELRCWDVADGRAAWPPRAIPATIFTAAFSPDGKKLATGDRYGAVRLWKPETGEPAGSWTVAPRFVRDLAFTPDGKQLACGDWEGGLKLCDVATGKVRATFRGFARGISVLALNSDGTRLVAGGQDRVIRVWDVATGALLHQFQGHRGHTHGVGFQLGTGRVVSAGYDGTIKVWDPDRDSEAVILSGNRLEVAALAFSPDSDWLAAAEGDQGHPWLAGAVQLWDARSFKKGPRLAGHTGGAFGVAFMPDRRHLASAGADGTVRVWEVATGREVRTLKQPGAEFRSVAVHPAGAYVAAATVRGAVVVWDATSDQPVLTLSTSGGAGQRLAFSPDGRSLAASDPDGVRAWSVPDGRVLFNYPRGGAGAIAMSQDGRTAAFAISDNVHLFDAGTRQALHTFRAHSWTVHGVTFSPDGRRVASCSWDQTVRLFDLATGEETLTLPTDSRLLCVAFSPDGRCLASAGGGPVMVWRAGRTGDGVSDPRRGAKGHHPEPEQGIPPHTSQLKRQPRRNPKP